MEHPLSRFYIQPGGLLQGKLRVPGDKSISHRAVMLGAIADGFTHVSGFLEGQDCVATLNAFRAMGVEIEGPAKSQVVIHGVGKTGLKPPKKPLDLGNSGTSMRLLAGLLSGQSFPVTLIGDQSLSRRPMSRIVVPLARMGARIESSAEGTPPISIKPVAALKAIDYDMPVASAQVKSSILLAGLYAKGTTCVKEPVPTRDHTERMLSCFGCRVDRRDNQVCLAGEGQLIGSSINVPADISSAAFFIVGATIAEGSRLLLQHVGINPTRTGVIDILRLMGAKIELRNMTSAGGEPVADIWVESARLQGIEIPLHLVPLAIDEFPAIFIAAACATGQTVLKGAQELRIKESDRLKVMAEGLQTCGITAEPTPDGMSIHGGQMKGGCVYSHGDHRIAMAFAIAGLKAVQPLAVEGAQNVNTSFPGFLTAAEQVGLRISSPH